MINIPNPWISDSVPCVSDADTALASCAAPTLDAGVVSLESAPVGPCHGPASVPTTAAGVAPRAPADFSFDPPQAFFDALEDRIMGDLSDFHPRDLDLDPLPLFLRDPSEAYLNALTELAGTR